MAEMGVLRMYHDYEDNFNNASGVSHGVSRHDGDSNCARARGSLNFRIL